MAVVGLALSLGATCVAAQDCLEPTGRWPYGVATDVAVEGSVAILANGAAVQILDLGDPTAPVVLGEVRTSLMVDKVAIAGDRVYAATHAGLEIIDISTPESPLVVGELQLWKLVDAIEVIGDRVYLAGGDLDIVDVGTPSAPVVIGSWTELATVDVDLLGSYAVVSVPHGLRVLDVSSPSSPVVVGQLDLGSDHWVQVLDLTGNHAIVLGFQATVLEDGLSSDQFLSVDLTDPTQPVVVSVDLWGGDDIEIRDGLARVVDAQGLEIYDVNDPANPVHQGGFGYPSLYISFRSGVAAMSGHALVTREEHGLGVISVSDPSTPILVAELDAPGVTLGADRAGDLVVIAAVYRGLRFVDVGDPAHPVELGFFNVGTMFPNDVVIETDLAYATGHGGTGLAVIDIGNPIAPVAVASLLGMWGGEIIDVAGGLAYIVCLDPGLRIIDISAPAAPIQVGALDSQGASWDEMAVSAELGLVALIDQGNDTIATIVDIENPAAPTVVSTIDLGPGLGVAFSGRYLLFGDIPLRIFDMSDPAAPVEQSPYDPWGSPAYIGPVGVIGSVAYVQVTPAPPESFLVAVNMGDPRSPTNLGSSPLAGYGNRLSVSSNGVLVTYDPTGFESFSLCHDPIFADGFESGDPSAWSSSAP